MQEKNEIDISKQVCLSQLFQIKGSTENLTNNMFQYFYRPDEKQIEQDKYELFNEWCKKEGVIMPKLMYPCTYDNGIVGV